ncbi:hypothetical protein IG631_16282 [Alternaria alternata]|nr:hypothetical protein IG631_16282 [Alternaria alternata]
MHRVRCLTSHALIAGHAEEGTKRMRHILTSTKHTLAATTGGEASGCSLPSLARSEPEHFASARFIARTIQAYNASASDMPLDVACRMTSSTLHRCVD